MQHLKEGTIHAWLDGALAADEAARVGRHASECAACAALVAEARGLVAGASRILSALDEVGAVMPGQARAEGGGRRAAGPPTLRPPPSALRPRWSRPGTLAAAATVVLMAGSALVLRNSGQRMEASSGEPASQSAQAADTASFAPQVERASQPAAAGPTAGSTVAAAGTAASGRRDGSARGAVSRDAVSRDAVSRDAVGRDAVSRVADAPAAAPSERQGFAAVPANPAPPQVARPTAAAESRQARAAPGDQPRRRFGEQLRLNEVVVTSAAPAPAAQKSGNAPRTLAHAPVDSARLEAFTATDRADTAGARRTAARRAAARTERAPPAAVEQRMAEGRARVDTVYRSRGDTVTVVVEGPDSRAGLRGAGQTVIPARAFALTGCYEVVEGRLPAQITLTTDHVWSGVAEQRFVVTAPGAIGYWSQPKTGDVHLVIAGMLTTARVDPSTGELRGEIQTGKRERFVARKGCR